MWGLFLGVIMRLITIKKLSQFDDNPLFKKEKNYITISPTDTMIIDFIMSILFKDKTPFIFEYIRSETICYGYDEELKYTTNIKISYSYENWISLQTNRYNQAQLLNLL